MSQPEGPEKKVPSAVEPAGASPTPSPIDDDLGDETRDDPLFRAQMALANFVLGYWRHLVGALALVLALIAASGLYRDYTRAQQESAHAEVARAMRALPAPDPMAALMGGSPEDAATLAPKAAAAAGSLEAVAQANSGPAAAYAWMEAATQHGKAGQAEQALAAWQKGHALGAKGILGWRLASGLARAQMDKGDLDGALVTLRGYADAGEGAMAEEALYLVGRALLDAGRKPESVQVFDQFEQRFPNSALKPQVTQARAEAAG